MKYFKISDFYEDKNAERMNINNKPDEKFIVNIMELTHDLLEPLRGAWGAFCKKNNLGNPNWKIIAGYRCDYLNKFYEGKKSSPHLKGFAIDFKLSNNEYSIFHSFAGPWLRDNGIKFDEIIWDFYRNYIHLSIKNNEGKQRSHIKKIK